MFGLRQTMCACDFCAELLVFHHKLLHSFLKRRQNISYLFLGKPARDVLLAIPVERIHVDDEDAFDRVRVA